MSIGGQCAGTTGRCLAICAALLFAGGCEHSPRGTDPGIAAPRSEAPVVDVPAVALRRGSIAVPVSAPGSVVARRESHIGAEVSGRIMRVHVVEGDRVDAGAVLFEIDPAPYEMAWRQTQAGLDVARAERQQLAVDLRRAETLLRQNVLSQQEIERLATSLDVARARERQAAEAVALARTNLDRTVVRAPYTASVAARLADEGSSALVQPQTIVIVLQETAELEARAAIPESQMSLVRPGDAAIVHIEGLREPIRTQVGAVSDSIDVETRTYMVKMPVPNPERRIKAGVFAHVEIHPARRDDAVLAPRESIRVEDGRSRLLVVRNGRAAMLPVDVGAASEREAEIRSGADAGELAIVGDAASTIAPGLRVRAVTAPPEPAS